LIYNNRWHSIVPILLFNNKTEMHLNYPFTGVYILLEYILGVRVIVPLLLEPLSLFYAPALGVQLVV